jgi:ABC-2 type transport system permease protein
MYPLNLIKSFIRVSVQQDVSYRANFWINLLHSLLNLTVAILAILVLFAQIKDLNGWDLSATLGLVGVYLTVSALRGLFIGPSLEALVGLGQEIWSGQFDFTLLRPVNTQFLVTFRIWRLYALLDLILGAAVIVYAVTSNPLTIVWLQWLYFFLAMIAAVVTLYAILLAFSALVFWSPGFLFTWVFDALFQLARYPIGIYPPLLRLLLTWIIPIAIITTVPAQALNGQSDLVSVAIAIGVAAILFLFASWIFQKGIKRYHSASS